MKVLLLFPPQWTAAQPYFGLTALNGQLRRAGHDVVVRDLNLELIEHVLSAPAVRLGARRVVSERQLATTELALRMASPDDAEPLGLAAARLKAIEGYLERCADRLDRMVARAGEVAPALRDPARYFDPRQYLEAMAGLDAALELYSMPYYPSAIRWNDFSHPTCKLNLAPLIALCHDRKLNPFIRFYERKLPELAGAGAQLAAVSINSFSQLVPGLTLAAMLKDARAPLHLSLGGNFFSRLHAELRGQPAFFASFADSVITGEGERPLVELCQAIEEGDPAKLARVPALLYRERGSEAIRANAAAPNYRMSQMAFQELEGFPLERYLAPERVVCLRASKGCYWGQCSFCDSYHGLEPDSVPVERVVEEVRHLRDRYGVRHFEFVDQCIAPDILEKLSEAFIAAKLGVRWFCNARTEQGFTPGLLESMRRAGNTMVLWGVESGSARLLKLMRKGVSPEGRLRILRDSAAAGLWNFAYVFFGFPTETEAEAQATIDLLCQNAGVIHSYGRSVFTLGKHSPLVRNPEESGILSIVEDRQELSTNLTYQPASGLTAGELGEVSRRCLEACRAAYGDPLWMSLRSRETLHLFLAHHGRAFVEEYDFQAAAAGDAGFIF